LKPGRISCCGCVVARHTQNGFTGSVEIPV
jgi:hypothetical protein